MVVRLLVFSVCTVLPASSWLASTPCNVLEKGFPTAPESTTFSSPGLSSYAKLEFLLAFCAASSSSVIVPSDSLLKGSMANASAGSDGKSPLSEGGGEPMWAGRASRGVAFVVLRAIGLW